MRVPEDKIEEIRSATDIVDVVSTYVRLKKRGKNFVGLCPFHKEKTPSFTVSPEKQMYYCFGCGEGGNVFTFLMQFEKLSFIEVIQNLADSSGISLPGYGPSQDSPFDNLHKANSIAARYFHNALMESKEGEYALSYLKDRGFTDASIKMFGLGYAPRDWELLIKHALKMDLPVEDLDKAGLTNKRNDGSRYDRFRGRLIFPLFSHSGKVVAFAGRKLYEDDKITAKYINSPETPIYQKGKLLYGLSFNRDVIRRNERAVLVEGYTDLISLYQEGIQNVVATGGTALTENQIDVLKKYAKEVIIVYDADSAGSSAALRGVGLILERGLDVRIADLPLGEDPDSIIRKKGEDAFNSILDNSKSFIDFQTELLLAKGLLKTPEGRTRAVRSIMQTVLRIPDELKRRFYIKHLAERYGIAESMLYGELDKLRNLEKDSPSEIKTRQSQSSSDGEIKRGKEREIETAVRDIFKLLLDSSREVVEYIFTHVSAKDFLNPDARLLYERLSTHYQERGILDVNTLLIDDKFEKYKKIIPRLMAEKYSVSSKWGKLRESDENITQMHHAIDAVRALKKKYIQRKIAVIREKIREAEQNNIDSVSLARELDIFQKELQEIEKGA